MPQNKPEETTHLFPTVGAQTERIGDGARVEAAADSRAMTVAYDDRFILRDTNGRALAYTAYAVRREPGAFEYGEPDGDGRTHLPG